jgi:radical SAM superfamily enzyme YgiQ (UPF0313 family)
LLTQRVLLTHSNHVFSDPKQTAKMQPYPPLQTLIAAAVLRENGVQAELFDPTLAEDPRGEFRASVERLRPDWIFVCEDDFNFLTKMCLAQNRELAFDMAAVARAAGIRSIAHGHDAAEQPMDYLAAGFDTVIPGEVERSVLDAIAGRPLGSAPENLDALPDAAWDLVDMERYRRAWMNAHGFFSLNMVSSRGCPYRCNWCAKPVHGNRYRVRSAEAVAAEMRMLKQRFRPDQIWFADDIFALSHRWTEEFASAVSQKNASIPFRMQSRCDLMTRDTVAALRAAGASEIWMGAESGSQYILDAMDKGIQVSDIYAARENLRRHKIRACFFLQFGYPGEGWREIEETLRMVRETRPDDVGISVSYPLPGTAFYDRVAAEMGMRSQWRHSADLAMLFRGRYSTEFYRALADAIHLEVRSRDTAAAVDAWERVITLRDVEGTISPAVTGAFPILQHSTA